MSGSFESDRRDTTSNDDCECVVVITANDATRRPRKTDRHPTCWPRRGQAARHDRIGRREPVRLDAGLVARARANDDAVAVARHRDGVQDRSWRPRGQLAVGIPVGRDQVVRLVARLNDWGAERYRCRCPATRGSRWRDRSRSPGRASPSPFMSAITMPHGLPAARTSRRVPKVRHRFAQTHGQVVQALAGVTTSSLPSRVDVADCGPPAGLP